MNAPSLAGFLDMTQARYRLFDLGTHLRKLPSQTLHKLDTGEPYPHPHLGYGWMVIFLWNESLTEQNSLWFLKLPLDEQGILPAAVHSDLVNRLYKALQTGDAKERQRLLTDHPYQFSPDPEKMAALHAQATQTLGLPPSDYHAPARAFYLENQKLDQHWSGLGLQGIADLVCRANDDELNQLCRRVEALDAEPQRALLTQLEHRPLPTAAVEALVNLAETREPQTLDLHTAALRAGANSTAFRLFEPTIHRTLEAPDVSLEFILTVLTRYTALLTDVELTVKTLDRLAVLADADGFARVVTNLAMQPGMNGIVAKILGSSHLTDPLGHALGRLIQQQRGLHS
ncbi:DUF3549 family protein [Reinekea blandensis]|uniref:DUF3549 domain-containing protein n=1 Tax=Reinekea blandensis MED297 TaxID=314283 RepID=A4BGS4_9GAMM|nr:DUF3549 family protein [Reinekea blandensis]EAR08722.1 hypothetical protein MED297_14440 [Reinekea sp. MED297] [Reinekea blandensis MED297]